MITPADMRRIMLLRRYRLGGYSPATGYRTNDLVLHLDGIQNTRLSEHSNDAAIWEDLSPTKNDVTLYNATWGNKYAAFSGAANSYGQGARHTFTNDVTMEIVFERTRTFDATGLEYLAGWPLYGDSIYRPTVLLSPSAGIRGSSANTGLFSIKPSPVPNSEFCYVAATGSLMAYKSSVSEHGGIFNCKGPTTNRFRLAATGDMYNNVMDIYHLIGRIYAVRVYAANLTSNELQAHLLIDKARFNIPE